LGKDATSESWVIETVDTATRAGFFNPMALNEGSPHVAYSGAHGEVRYAHWTGSDWVVDTVDMTHIGRGLSMALDSDGYAHMAYLGKDDQSLRYAHWTGSNWALEQVGGPVWSIFSPGIAVDSTNYPHIAYAGGRALNYARWNGSTWMFDILDSTVSAVQYVAMVLDSSDCSHVCYGMSGLKYAKRTGSVWSIDTVDPVGGSHNAIVLDNNGYAHISYVSLCELSARLMYARWTGSAWETEIIDSVGLYDGEYRTSIALDSDGYPHISYPSFDTAAFDSLPLKCAKWTGSEWVIDTVDIGRVDGYTSLVIDDDDAIHISYHGKGGLKYAYSAAGIEEEVFGETYPEFFSVSCFPNPSHNGVSVSYELLSSCHISLRIYDVAGHCVKTLVNAERRPGYHNVTLDAGELGTGIYFARFVAGNHKEIKKLILMR
jgi:hypothetical protein